ncbi:hypothetical protein HWQ46_05600 [Shewanella sp. D64]|uniref:hypothetical protein n=1 Tax=unclassified Shewanella TaxID=196818 RepID=UPI0022BA22CF|nr:MULTISPECIES: hypothetical protein [unclassified Shewanella]MEC4725027.1 hypothetical protein [Shewanella sp. D64]MEC4736928.1 hypothetical protein [Shewanella sp. E94]WBJ96523.1 hypothetical protein HWQ47_05205 [Shewanella sp. MTB7]
MKKSLATMIVIAGLTTGCASTSGSSTVSYNDLKAQGNSLYADSKKEAYKPSKIQELEVGRTIVNTAFLTAKPLYEEYILQIQSEPVVNNYFGAVEAAKSEEEKQAIYDALGDNQTIIDDFNNSEMTKKVMVGLGEAVVIATKSLVQFKTIDTTSLISSVDFTDMMSEKSNLGLTLDQITYLNDSVISAYDNYQIISAFRNAQ